MYKVFDTIEKLYNEIEEDRNWNGVDSTTRNRYPLRFILLENFFDFYNFTQQCTGNTIIRRWINDDYPDQMLTYTQLANRFEEYVKASPVCDIVIAPFSELTRFLKEKEFISLVTTIRLIESSNEAQQNHQRIYVPIIGMQNKMISFKDDPNIRIWEYSPNIEGTNYQLILTNGTTYKVNGLDENYAVCHDLREWLSLWENTERVKKCIICSSKSIYSCAEYAQPDNAFDYIICNNAYEFLTKGLKLEFGDVQFRENELTYWEKLASHIDVKSFSYDGIVKDLLKAYSLKDEADFVKAWFENKDDFKRWLLKTYFLSIFADKTYLKVVLKNCESQTDSEFLSILATKIFDIPFDENFLNQRLSAIREVIKYEAQITETDENKIRNNLIQKAENPEEGHYQAMKYMTPLTISEKTLMLKWYGETKITRDDIKGLFPELFHYTASMSLQLEDKNLWVNNYFDEYHTSKISNKITPKLKEILNEKNTSTVTFNTWSNNFQTVKTCLYNRYDIEIYYWIDGLGIDWIPYLKYLMGEYSVNGVYLNEIIVAKAELPTITDINRVKLEELSKDTLKKAGDLDENAHKYKDYPLHILEEFEKLKDIVASILNKYNGKKIAFVSDHGISYLAAMSESPLSLGGYTAKHSGRYAVCNKGDARQDNNYVILDDKKTICSLTHRSLSSKTQKGTGAHGGATPEEVLVPIIIVSNHKNASNYTATLKENVISANSPIVKYEIRGHMVDIPKLLYNGIEYEMTLEENGIYKCKLSTLDKNVNTVKLIIGDFSKTDNLTIETGFEEDDLFDI